MMKRVAILGFVSCVLLALWVRAGEFPDGWTWDDEPGARAKHAALEGKEMPKLEVTGWVNGEVKPEDMKGKVVVVDFYATWCGIVGVCTSDNGQEKMEQTAKDRGMEYPTAKDPDLKSEKAWDVHYYPTYAIIDRKGILRAIGIQTGHVEDVVKKLLAEKE
jgi:peroxiredoxin